MLGGDRGLSFLALVPPAQSASRPQRWRRPGPSQCGGRAPGTARRGRSSPAPSPPPALGPAPDDPAPSPPPRARFRRNARAAPDRERRGCGSRGRGHPLPLLLCSGLGAGHAPGSGRSAHTGPAMRSGAERRGSSAAAPPGSPPTGRARPAGPDAPPALPPPAAGQPRARDAGDARAQPRPLFPWSKWKKRMGSSMSAATARRPVFDDKEDGECGRAARFRAAPGDSAVAPPPGDPTRFLRDLLASGHRGPLGRRLGESRFVGTPADAACGGHARAGRPPASPVSRGGAADEACSGWPCWVRVRSWGGFGP